MQGRNIYIYIYDQNKYCSFDKYVQIVRKKINQNDFSLYSVDDMMREKQGVSNKINIKYS